MFRAANNQRFLINPQLDPLSAYGIRNQAINHVKIFDRPEKIENEATLSDSVYRLSVYANMKQAEPLSIFRIPE
jgi:hypothetical protein